MGADIVVQRAAASRGMPSPASVRRWAGAALDAGGAGKRRLTVRITGEEEMSTLNARYRGKATATNVLAFPLPLEERIDGGYLGDVVVCAPVVVCEAADAGIPVEARWAHMVVHGVLHLCGHDHAERRQARRMEALESGVLTALGYADPWRTNARAG